MTLQLVIGNKNYSSWSFRPWIAMKVAGIAFDEEVISLDAKDFKARVTRISGTGKVPALADGSAPAAAAVGQNLIPATNATVQMIDVAQVQGQVHAQSVHRVGELAERNPNETASIVRQWLAEPA